MPRPTTYHSNRENKKNPPITTATVAVWSPARKSMRKTMRIEYVEKEKINFHLILCFCTFCAPDSNH